MIFSIFPTDAQAIQFGHLHIEKDQLRLFALDQWLDASGCRPAIRSRVTDKQRAAVAVSRPGYVFVLSQCRPPVTTLQ
jgi:hypothetical protein